MGQTVFLTNATGYVGGVIAEQLLAQGNDIVALVRTQERAEGLRAKGIEPVLGDLSDVDILRRQSSQADAVLHTAFVHDGSLVPDAVIALDRTAINTMIDGLAGSNKTLVVTGVCSGDTGVLPAKEDLPVDVNFQPYVQRSQCERAAILGAAKGVRTVVMRLPGYVYGRGGSAFVPMQLAAYKKAGAAYYYGAADHMASAVHVDDAAAAYILAIDKAPPGSVFHIANEHGLRADAIAQALADNIGGDIPVSGAPVAEAAEKSPVPVWIVPILAHNNQIDGGKAKEVLGWDPKPRPGGMLEDIRSGSYSTK